MLISYQGVMLDDIWSNEVWSASMHGTDVYELEERHPMSVLGQGPWHE